MSPSMSFWLSTSRASLMSCRCIASTSSSVSKLARKSAPASRAARQASSSSGDMGESFRSRRSMRVAELFEAVEPLLDHVEAGRVAETDRHVVTEGQARDRGDAVAGEELLGKIHRAEAHLRGVDEEVEG